MGTRTMIAVVVASCLASPLMALGRDPRVHDLPALTEAMRTLLSAPAKKPTPAPAPAAAPVTAPDTAAGMGMIIIQGPASTSPAMDPSITSSQRGRHGRIVFGPTKNPSSTNSEDFQRGYNDGFRQGGQDRGTGVSHEPVAHLENESTDYIRGFHHGYVAAWPVPKNPLAPPDSQAAVEPPPAPVPSLALP